MLIFPSSKEVTWSNLISKEHIRVVLMQGRHLRTMALLTCVQIRNATAPEQRKHGTARTIDSFGDPLGGTFSWPRPSHPIFLKTHPHKTLTLREGSHTLAIRSPIPKPPKIAEKPKIQKKSSNPRLAHGAAHQGKRVPKPTHPLRKAGPFHLPRGVTRD